MAVSKRLRYEILRRDNHTCRYCGRSAPEVRLTVDHVLPVALGGRDDAENLVACCGDCNSGKTSTPPDAPLLANVQEDALRWSAAMHAAIARAAKDHEAALGYRRAFIDAWCDWTIGGEATAPRFLPDGWETSVENFRTRGLPIEILTGAVDKAMGAKHVAAASIFKYMCGIAWSTISQIEANAREIFEASDEAPVADAAQSAEWRRRALFMHLHIVWAWAWDRTQPGEQRTEADDDAFAQNLADLLEQGASALYDLTDAAFEAGSAHSPEIGDFIAETAEDH